MKISPLLRSLTSIALSAVTLMLCSTAHAQMNQTKKFELAAGPCAATGYPMTIRFGAFTSSPGVGFPVPSGHHLNGKFGLSSRSWAVGDPMQRVPKRLELLYFSLLEDKFYYGEFALPSESIRSLLTQGFWDYDKKKQATFHKFTVCVLPKGAVVVWLTGVGKQVVVGRFQAKESNTDAQDFKQEFPTSDRAEMLKESLAEVSAEVRAEVATGRLSANRWDQYLMTYPWKIEASLSLAMSNYRVNFLSGAYTVYPASQDRAAHIEFLTTPIVKAVPEKISMAMTASSGKNFDLKVDLFDENQTQAAFQTLQRILPGAPITLWFEVDPAFKTATLTLLNTARKISLDKSTVRIVSY